jgi:membrane-associated protein
MITLLDAFHWSQLLQPQFYIEHGGLWLIMFVVFAETGLFAGFFLPGDSLLFVAGIYCGPLAAEIFTSNNEWINLLVLFLFISTAGIIGNYVGYYFGRKVGPTMYDWKENLFFKKKYLLQAEEFYVKHGGRAIVIARFIPIVRTFAPIIAGIVQMDKRKFMYNNIVGCICWVASMLSAGFFLQSWILTHFNFDLKHHLEVIVLGIVFITTAPVIIKVMTHKPSK